MASKVRRKLSRAGLGHRSTLDEKLKRLRLKNNRCTEKAGRLRLAFFIGSRLRINRQSADNSNTAVRLVRKAGNICNSKSKSIKGSSAAAKYGRYMPVRHFSDGNIAKKPGLKYNKLFGKVA